MSFEVAFVAVYSLALTAVAVGLHRIGRISTDPRASRMLAAYRRQTGDGPDASPAADGPDWPHAVVPRLYTVIAAVAAAAGVALMLMELVRQHSPAEAAVELAVAAVCSLVCVRMLRRLSAAGGAHAG